MVYFLLSMDFLKFKCILRPKRLKRESISDFFRIFGRFFEHGPVVMNCLLSLLVIRIFSIIIALQWLIFLKYLSECFEAHVQLIWQRANLSVLCMKIVRFVLLIANGVRKKIPLRSMDLLFFVRKGSIKKRAFGKL